MKNDVQGSFPNVTKTLVKALDDYYDRDNLKQGDLKKIIKKHKVSEGAFLNRIQILGRNPVIITAGGKEKGPLTLKERIFIKNNFDLPKGVKDWNFLTKDNPGGYKYGFSPKNNQALVKQILYKMGDAGKDSISIGNRSTTKGWMMYQMERAWQQKIKTADGTLMYKPVWRNVQGERKIIGFTDRSKFGGGKTYFFKDDTAKRLGGHSYTKHVDFDNTNKFLLTHSLTIST